MPDFSSAIWNKPAAADPPSGDVVTKSLRFEKSSTSNLNQDNPTPDSARKMTLSFWVKLVETPSGETALFTFGGSAAGGGSQCELEIRQKTNGQIYIKTNVNNAYVYAASTTRVFRDFSSWYHIVIAWDTEQSSSADRLKFYVNNEQETLVNNGTASATFPTLDYDDRFGSTGTDVKNRIGSGVNGASTYVPSSSYMADIIRIDGQQLTPSSFAEEDTTTGQWKPKATSGLTFGSAGFRLDFEDADAIGNDVSGEGNDFSGVSNLAASDVMDDLPTDSLATWNPLIYRRGGSHIFTYSEGNTKAVYTGGVSHAQSTIASSGRHYAEFDASGGSSDISGAGVVRARWDDGMLSSYAQSYGGAVFGSDGDVTSPSGVTSHTAVGSNRQGVAFDGAANKVDFYIVESDGTMTLQKSLTSSDSIDFDGEATFTISSHDTGATTFNGYFSSDKWWADEAPTIGGNATTALSTGNLPTPTIAKPAEHFDTLLYPGTTSTNDVDGLDFTPNLVWFKKRSGTEGHYLLDDVRGLRAGLNPNTALAEDDVERVSSFDGGSPGEGGFTAANSNGYMNESGYIFVAWCWKVGVEFEAESGVSDSGSKNVDAGFSIATWSGDDSGGLP